MDGGDGAIDHVNVLNATELYIWKWLKVKWFHVMYALSQENKRVKGERQNCLNSLFQLTYCLLAMLKNVSIQS